MNVLNVFGPVLVSKLNEGDRPVVMEFKSLRIFFLIKKYFLPTTYKINVNTQTSMTHSSETSKDRYIM